MLRKRGIKVVSITEHADDSPTGKLMEAIIESVDEFYSENLAQEVTRGMREAASRGFWVASSVPYGYARVSVQDGAKKRPKLEPDPMTARVVQRMYRMAESGSSVLDITKMLNDEGIASSNGKLWSKTMVHYVLTNEVYTGTLVWGTNAKDKSEPVRVENTFPAIVSRDQFTCIAAMMRSRAPSKVNPRRISSSYLLSGLVKCAECGKALTGHDAKSGKYAYYICQSLAKRGSGACSAPRLNAKRFEQLIVDQIRENILTESNIRDLVQMVDEEMDGVAREQRDQDEAIQGELAEVRRRLDRLWHVVETTELDIDDIAPRIREHRERQERLEVAAEEVRSLLSERRHILDDVETITIFAQDMSRFLTESPITESKAFIRSFVKEIAIRPDSATIRYTIPMPKDSPIGGKDADEIALRRSVLSSVRSGTPAGTRTRAHGLGNHCSIL